MEKTGSGILIFNLKFIIHMTTISIDAIRTFLAVAELRSFTLAARRLGVTPTAASKAIRVLEAQHGIPLFTRNTRNVTPTEAGLGLYADLAPVTGLVEGAFAKLTAYREQPVGNLRLTVPRALGAVVLGDLVPRFRRACPHVTLDISLDDDAVDIVARGFDAGIRIGHQVEPDMIAVPLTAELCWSVVASPAYLGSAGKPAAPEELIAHDTIRYRFHGTGKLHRWSFVRDGAEFHVETKSSLVVDDTGMIAEFARSGMGMAYLPAIEIAGDVAAGRLVAVLQEFVPPTPGLYLYFPAKSQGQRKLRAFIDMARLPAALKEGALTDSPTPTIA